VEAIKLPGSDSRTERLGTDTLPDLVG
jgi:hypothetical protein